MWPLIQSLFPPSLQKINFALALIKLYCRSFILSSLNHFLFNIEQLKICVPWKIDKLLSKLPLEVWRPGISPLSFGVHVWSLLRKLTPLCLIFMLAITVIYNPPLDSSWLYCWFLGLAGYCRMCANVMTHRNLETERKRGVPWPENQA